MPYRISGDSKRRQRGARFGTPHARGRARGQGDHPLAGTIEHWPTISGDGAGHVREHLSRVNVPDTHRDLARTHEALAIGCKPNGKQRAAIATGQHGLRLTGARVPHPRQSITAGGNNPAAIGTERCVEDLTGDACERSQFIAADAPQADRAV